ncbi:HNH endonuclease [Lacticaseibacillus mingshuiensis]|uniref:HNH endonuclease n=1 Tax=Lacticaseibacillus mingshuiensis TaxID=2799574 RepID=A0ABW4CFS0_9LACO|nr:HNH endonuclease [Lacticaseibacillus mingshuiensis]
MTDQLARQFGHSLYQLRVSKNVSRQTVVDHNEISLNALTSIENGQATPKLETLKMLLQFYGLSFPQFFSQLEDNEESSGLNQTLRSLVKADARFFILDTKGATKDNNYQDQDFITYQWNERIFGKVREGDWFIYRRPASASKTGDFYFFGAGQIGRLTHAGNGDIKANLVNAFPFEHFLLKDDDLNSFQWHFKTRTRHDWMHFFNQYGMTRIDPDDFFGLIALVDSHSTQNTRYDLATLREEQEIYRTIQTGADAPTEQQSLETQRIGQGVLAEIVKSNYTFHCAITGISTRNFLVASHIIPWAKDPTRRLDPTNVICLSSLMDRAFDQGFITFDPAHNNRLVLAKVVHEDRRLEEALKPFSRKPLEMPIRARPSAEALQYHNDVIFRGN